MSLRTLGRIELSGGTFRQDKLLLLAAYLALEGPKPRKFLAELFWPTTVNPMGSLAGALYRMRKSALVEADNARVWTRTECDAVLLQEHLRAGRLREAVDLYSGAFAESLTTDIGEELDEWLLETRERLAAGVRMALLTLAEHDAARAAFSEAAAKAETAYTLPGAAPLEAEELIRLHRLLLVAEHPLRETLAQEARELGIAVGESVEASRGMLQQILLGRKRELEVLMALRAGEWAWVQGGNGMGKTLLLRELEGKGHWRYVPARSGLPFATLEPLLADLEGGEEVVVRRMARLNQDFLFDDWENIDPESQQVLVRLRNLRPGFRVVLAGLGEAAVRVDQLLHLRALLPEDLATHAGAYEATDGVPGLVGAWLRGEPLEIALETRLSSLAKPARELYGALTLLETPDLGLVRQALGMDAPTFAQGQEALLAAGLIEPSGQARGSNAAFFYFQDQPNVQAKLALALARHLKDEKAQPLYQLSRTLWEDGDLPKVQQAYLWWANELLRRGFPMQAAETLDEAPTNTEITFQKAKMLTRAHRLKEALEILTSLPESPEVFAFRADILFRFGNHNEARKLAQKTLEGSVEARAHGQHILAKIALSSNQLREAERLFQRAGTLWLAIGQETRWADALNGYAIARFLLDPSSDKAFNDALDAAGENPTAKSLVLLNMGQMAKHKKDYSLAERDYSQALELSRNSGALYAATLAWNNLGTLYHTQGKVDEAKSAYEEGLSVAQQMGDQELIGTLVANLAELAGDITVWEGAIEYLEAAGFHRTADAGRMAMKAYLQRSTTSPLIVSQ